MILPNNILSKIINILTLAFIGSVAALIPINLANFFYPSLLDDPLFWFLISILAGVVISFFIKD